MQTKKNPTSRHPAFTLVELLVVVVMIAVLAFIVFSFSRKAMDKAHTVSCTNNLRQIGLAMTSFHADNNRYPSNLGTAWDRSIIPYLGYGGSKSLAGNGNLTKSQWPELVNVAAYFDCPSDKYSRSSNVYKRSYAVVPWTTNHFGGGVFRGWKDRAKNVGVPISIVPDPERSAIVVEWHQGTEGTENACGSGAHAFHDSPGPDSAGREVHDNKSVVLFADLHTEILPFMSGAKFREKYWAGSIQTE